MVAQAPAPATLVAKGSPVNASIGVQVAGLTAARGGQTLAGEAAGAAAAAAGSTLARTGGLALGGLALWLLIGGLTGRVAGSRRLWRLARRLKG